MTRDEINQRNREWRASHPDRVYEYQRRYRQANPEKVNEMVKQWRDAHPEYKIKRRAYMREWRARRKEKPVKQLSMLPDVPAVEVEPKVHLVTAEDVRKEDKLDRPKIPHKCTFYPPAYRCLCGKRRDEAQRVTA
jgi:hypothetical protein